MYKILSFNAYCNEERNGFRSVINERTKVNADEAVSIGGGCGGAGHVSIISVNGCGGGGGGASSATIGSNSYTYAKSYIENAKSDKENSKNESIHDKVARILKGDFEKYFGMSFDTFTEIHNEIIEKYPEKLI